MAGRQQQNRDNDNNTSVLYTHQQSFSWIMSSSETPSRYIPPHRRQQQQQNQSCTPQTTPGRLQPSPSLLPPPSTKNPYSTPRRFQPSPSIPPSSTKKHYSSNSHGRRRPRDSSTSSQSWTTPTTNRTPQSATPLSARAPVWTPVASTDPTTNSHQSTATSSQDGAIAESLFDRIVCINLTRRPDRWSTFQKRMRLALGVEHGLLHKVERFAAVDGAEVVPLDVSLEWDATQNAQYDQYIQPPMTKQMTAGEVGCAMSHIGLWKELAEMEETIRNPKMLVLEDDAILYQPRAKNEQWRRQTPHKNHRKGRYSDSFMLNNNRGNNDGLNRSFNAISWEGKDESAERIPSSVADGDNGFIPALLDVWKILPDDWDILYLGFSDRGERMYIDRTITTALPVTLFRPTYGFHTHAYALTQKAARVLLEHLPVQGPLDVWLADNKWFGLNVYCALIEDGTSFKGKLGAQLIAQQRHNSKSDIGMSGRESM